MLVLASGLFVTACVVYAFSRLAASRDRVTA
jgi:hypothetical protein